MLNEDVYPRLGWPRHLGSKIRYEKARTHAPKGTTQHSANTLQTQNIHTHKRGITTSFTTACSLNILQRSWWWWQWPRHQSLLADSEALVGLVNHRPIQNTAVGYSDPCAFVAIHRSVEPTHLHGAGKLWVSQLVFSKIGPHNWSSYNLLKNRRYPQMIVSLLKKNWVKACETHSSFRFAACLETRHLIHNSL